MEPEDYVVLRGANVAAAGTAIFGMDGTVRSSGGEAITLEYGTQRVESSADIEALEEDPGVVSMAPVMPLILHEPTARNVDTPADDGSTWGVAAVKAQQSPWDGAGITVAILDTGIDADHPAFAGVDLVQEDFTGDGIGDENGHGTHCAATVFGRDVDGLRIGVAPGVEKALIGKVLGDNGSGSTQSIIAGIEWAVSEGAHVISMSLGLDFPGLVKRLVEGRGFPVDLATSKALEAYAANLDVFRPLAEMVANRAELEGRATVIVAAAGNESQRDRNPNHKIAVAPPAAAPRIISVGALGVGDAGWEIGAFSNTGPKVCGPGVGVRSARTGGGLEGMNGTSMAAPHVAGVAALWAQRQLETIGAIDSFSLTAQVTAKSTHEGLAPNFDPKDVGMGMVQAPLG